MAPEKEKKAPALEYPPDASSSGEEEEDIEEEEGEEEEIPDQEREEEEEDEDDEEDEEDDDDEDGSDSRFTVKKHTAPTPKVQSSPMVDEEDESDGESDSDSEIPNTQVFDPNVKPLNSVPMEDSDVKEKKPRGSATPGKRSTEASNGKDSKRRKKSDDGEEIQKKSGGQKTWSEEDEIVILKAMISLMKKGGKPTELNTLYETLKTTLHGNVTRDQLTNKLRGFKRKYQGFVSRELKGEKLNLKPHDSKSYEYMKRIYDGDAKGEVSEAAAAAATANGGTPTPSVKKEGKSRSRKVSNNDVATPTPEVAASKDSKEEVIQEARNEASVGGGADDIVSRLSKSMNTGIDMLTPSVGLAEFLMREGLGLIGDSKKKDLEEKWRKLRIAESKVLLERTELVREQLKLTLAALESSNE